MHRIGQTAPVVVKRFIVADSIEENILELQERKRNLASAAFTKEKAQHTRLSDLKLLFKR